LDGKNYRSTYDLNFDFMVLLGEVYNHAIWKGIGNFNDEKINLKCPCVSKILTIVSMGF